MRDHLVLTQDVLEETFHGVAVACDLSHEEEDRVMKWISDQQTSRIDARYTISVAQWFSEAEATFTSKTKLRRVLDLTIGLAYVREQVRCSNPHENGTFEDDKNASFIGKRLRKALASHLFSLITSRDADNSLHVPLFILTTDGRIVELLHLHVSPIDGPSYTEGKGWVPANGSRYHNQEVEIPTGWKETMHCDASVSALDEIGNVEDGFSNSKTLSSKALALLCYFDDNRGYGMIPITALNDMEPSTSTLNLVAKSAEGPSDIEEIVSKLNAFISPRRQHTHTENSTNAKNTWPVLKFSGGIKQALKENHHNHLSPNIPHKPSLLTLSSRYVRTICCVGAGYVGGPTAAVIAYQNPHIRVTVVDRDSQRIRRWNSEHLPLYEPGLEEIVRIARDGSREFTFMNQSASAVSDEDSFLSHPKIHAKNKQNSLIKVQARPPNLFFSTDIERTVSNADLIIIAVSTPTKSRGVGAGSATDMTAFETAMHTVVQNAQPLAIIVEKSTVPCNTAQLIKETLLMHRPGVQFDILSNPEFLSAGTAVNDLLQPSRVIIGHDSSSSGKQAAQTLTDIYASWVPKAFIITTDIWSSELAKLAANAMLAQRISSINSISAICEKTGANVHEIAICIGSDPRIGTEFLKAGIGFGGSCFKKDILSLVYLADSLQLHEVGEYWRQVLKINNFQRERFSKRVIQCLNNTLVGKKVALLGYTFKAGTSDTRDSLALDIIKTLLEEQPKEIAVFDPCCRPVVIQEELDILQKTCNTLKKYGNLISVYDDVYEACADANAVLITTESNQFRYGSLQTSRHVETMTSVDPRPFEQYRPTEMEVLSLHRFLVSCTRGSAHDDDPLRRYNKQPSCADNCPDCCQREYTTRDRLDHREAEGRLDWKRIVDHLTNPKWVFDGKGLIDPMLLSRIGARVESIGR